MARHQHRVLLRIPNGQTTVEFKGKEALRTLAQAVSVSIHAPDAVDGVVSVEFANNEDPVAADYQVTSPATALTANTVTPLPQNLVAKALRIIQTVAAVADRDYILIAQIDATLAMR